jgi:hypothetical protein
MSKVPKHHSKQKWEGGDVEEGCRKKAARFLMYSKEKAGFTLTQPCVVILSLQSSQDTTLSLNLRLYYAG